MLRSPVDARIRASTRASTVDQAAADGPLAQWMANPSMSDYNAEVIQVIRTYLTTRGKGVDGDPIRRITQYWTTDGQLLAEVDPWFPTTNAATHTNEGES